MHAEKSQRILSFGVGIRQNGATVCGCLKENCCLIMDNLKIAFFGRRGVILVNQLKNLALGDFIRRIRHDFHNAHIADIDEELKSAGIDKVTN